MSNAGYQARERKGDVKAKQLRKELIVPGILYGGGFEESLMIEMDQGELQKLMRENSYSSSIPIKGLDKDINVIIKEIQTNFLTGIPTHFDFQAIKKGEIVTVAIPLRIVGEEALKGKDIFIQVDLNEVNIKGPIEKLPSHIDADVSKLELNDRIVLSELEFDKELEILEDPEAIVCIAHTSIVEEEEEVEATEEAAAPEKAAEDKE